MTEIKQANQGQVKEQKYYKAIGLIYSSQAGEGKTDSILRSAPRPIYYIYDEARTWDMSYEPLGLEEGKNIKTYIATKQTNTELLAHLQEIEKLCKEGKFKYKTLAFDSFGYWYNSKMVFETIDENIEVGVFAKQLSKDGNHQFKLSADKERLRKEDYGAMPMKMLRVLMALKRISQSGVIVLTTAQCEAKEEVDEFVTRKKIVPFLKGNMLLDNLKEHFDFIGYLTPRREKPIEGQPYRGRKLFPPAIQFDSPDGKFMYKWGGIPHPPAGYDDEGFPKYTCLADYSEILRVKHFGEDGKEIKKEPDRAGQEVGLGQVGLSWVRLG